MEESQYSSSVSDRTQDKKTTQRESPGPGRSTLISWFTTTGSLHDLFQFTQTLATALETLRIGVGCRRIYLNMCRSHLEAVMPPKPIIPSGSSRLVPSESYI